MEHKGTPTTAAFGNGSWRFGGPSEGRLMVLSAPSALS